MDQPQASSNASPDAKDAAPDPMNPEPTNPSHDGKLLETSSIDAFFAPFSRKVDQLEATQSMNTVSGNVSPDLLQDHDYSRLRSPPPRPAKMENLLDEGHRDFIAQKKCLDSPVPELPPDVRNVIQQICNDVRNEHSLRKDAEIHAMPKQRNKNANLPPVHSETFLRSASHQSHGRSSLDVHSPFKSDICSYKGDIWKYDPMQGHQITLLDPSEDILVDPSKFWIQRRFKEQEEPEPEPLLPSFEEIRKSIRADLA